LFLDQITQTLELEETSSNSERLSGPTDPTKAPAPSEIGRAAAKHGNDLGRQGFTVDQVVHDYGDLCQAVTELAVGTNAPITAAEFRTLNRCLDNAIADAVTEFSRQHDSDLLGDAAAATTERLGILAHEMRNLLDSAMLALAVMKAGKVGLSGATGQVLDRSLIGLRDLIERTIAEVRLTHAMTPRVERLNVAEFVAEVHISAGMQAKARGSELFVGPVDDALFINANRDLLSSALMNLLQNAFKFSKQHSHISLQTRVVADRILIDVEDECGGLPAGKAEELFQAFQQRGIDRTGLGLGLSISRQSIEAIGGELQVRDLPGRGCIFTISLPRC
ncbi:MAG: sensor histidine kinase, partial [Burkholderiales bacterium]